MLLYLYKGDFQVEILAQLEKVLDYQFKNKELLLRALTHPSYTGKDNTGNYQRLEYLGDATLELIVSRYLYELKDQATEGMLTKLRANIVSEKPLAAAAMDIGLGKYLRMSAGELKTNGQTKPSILSDAFEAVVAAVFLDGGYNAAQTLVLRLLQEQINKALTQTATLTDYKSMLQEELQSRGVVDIVYKCDRVIGPPHDSVFYSSVWAMDKHLGKGTGKSKKQSEQMAAKAALLSMGKQLD